MGIGGRVTSLLSKIREALVQLSCASGYGIALKRGLFYVVRAICAERGGNYMTWYARPFFRGGVGRELAFCDA